MKVRGKSFYIRFNWATTFQSWKFISFMWKYPSTNTVSIEPRLFSHGNKKDSVEHHPPPQKFQLSQDFSVMEIMDCNQHSGSSNGVSIEPRLFSHGNIDIINPYKHKQDYSFNWATTFQSWKCTDSARE